MWFENAVAMSFVVTFAMEKKKKTTNQTEYCYEIYKKTEKQRVVAPCF